jgi:flagellar export protein FliJ
MKRFRFRFETLLRLREAARDEAQLRLADALKAVSILEERIAAVVEERQQAKGARAARMLGSISAEQLLAEGRYDVQLDFQARELKSQLQQIDQEVDRRRQRLTLAEQECRKFERLKELANEKYTQDQLDKLQAELDELGAQRSFRIAREVE